ncbi:DNA polymerase III subunit gamma and tau [Streptomyces sp. MS2A]|nr:DNA polymerase III subunit gamma and tau [Streptomyces sp. MS2A]
MTTALYRRYRPETFGEMIGQSQVTDPLMTALRGDRVGHAYLFSGPRGCGKTTSARILARCLNCAEGPTDTPCGTCPSCVELSRAGGGSLDVVEIDAASHNGVDDARDLRERATFAPSRDRYKIFILDEAHMVTPQGFNALLKLVEEPPPHVKFIFATTEPEKVLGTIRSRTHHYPFRLVPPAAMLEYVEKLCAEEGVSVEQGVLPLVVRAGGGSPRDTLSLLDQLIAGSEGETGSVEVKYERAVALLGYTHAALLDEIVDALAAADASAAFPAVDRVVQTGQDPRRFVDDLLERLRDLIVIAAVGDGASAVLRGVPEDELVRMRDQAAAFGSERLSRTADLVSAALDDMTGATSPRLHLELMVARVLSAGEAGPAVVPAPDRARPGDAPAASRPTQPVETRHAGPAAPQSAVPTETPGSASASPASSTTGSAPSSSGSAPSDAGSASSPAASAPSVAPAPAPDAQAEAPAPVETGPVDFARIRAAWPAILSRLEKISRGSWLVVTAVQPLDFDTATDVLTLGFASPNDVARFKGTTPGSGTSDHLRSAIEQELGIKVKYKPAPLPPSGGSGTPEPPPSTGPGGSTPAPAAPSPPSGGESARPAAPKTASASAAPVTEWAVAPIPRGEPDAGPAVSPLGAAPAASPSAVSTPAAAPAVSPSAVSSIAETGTESTPPPPQFPVDEEPADVEAMPASGWYEPVHDGDVLDEEPPYPDDEPPYDPGPPPPDDAAPPATAPPAAAPDGTSARAPRPASNGVQRYGEAVVRQMLGARFVREEPYEPPTRFS